MRTDGKSFIINPRWKISWLYKRLGSFLDVFESSLLRSSMHLFDRKYSINNHIMKRLFYFNILLKYYSNFLLFSSVSYDPSNQILCSMFKTAVLLNIFVETVINFNLDSLINRTFLKTQFWLFEIFRYIICRYTVFFNAVNA